MKVKNDPTGHDTDKTRDDFGRLTIVKHVEPIQFGPVINVQTQTISPINPLRSSTSRPRKICLVL